MLLNPFFAFYVTGDGDICGGLTISDNSANTDYKCLHSLRYDVEMRGYVERHNKEVPHNTPSTTIAEGVMLAEVQNDPKNIHKSRKITEILTGVDQVSKHEGTAAQELEEFADEWTLIQSNESTNTTAQGATTSAGFLLLSSNTVFWNPSNWKLDSRYVLAWGSRTKEYWDDELGLKVTQTRSVVAHGTALPTPTPGSFPEQRQVDAWRDIKTVTTIDGYDVTKFDHTYGKTVQYTFPAILASWDGNPANNPVLPDWTPGNGWVSLIFDEGNERSVFQITIFTREAWTEGVQAQVRETLHTAAEMATILASSNTAGFGTGADLGSTTVKARLFAPRPRDIRYQGMMFELTVEKVLCDSDTLTATSDSEDTYYGPGKVDEFTYPDSFPTATDYIGLIGQTVCVEDTFEPWKYGLYMRRRTNIVLK